MFTNNYITLCRSRLEVVSGTYKVSNGTEKTVWPNAMMYADFGWVMHKAKFLNFSNFNVSQGSAGGVAFGTGTTPPAKEDYKLEAPITSGLEFTNFGARPTVESEGEGVYTLQASYVIKNTTSNAVVISEIGYFGELNGNTDSSPQYWPTLMERTVLDKPVTIPAGASKVITYKLTFHQS